MNKDILKYRIFLVLVTLMVPLLTFSQGTLSYCTPDFTSGVRPITNVTFAGINNTTPAAINGPDLQSFSNIATVRQGTSTNAISLKGNTNGNWTYYFWVYIDWDQNGVLGNNSNEIYNIGQITNSTGTDAAVLIGNISVPSFAVLGYTRMRVMKKLYGYQGSGYPSDPCQTGPGYGEAEDYTINILGNIEGPGGVASDLNLWLKADAGTNTTTEGNGITSWADQSSLGFDATGTGATTYLSSFSNFNPGLNFTNDPKPLSGSITRANGTGSTIFVVGNIPVVNDKSLIELGTPSARAFFIDQRYDSNTDYYSLQTNNTSVWSVSDEGGLLPADIYENGNNIQTTVTKYASTSWTTSGNYYIGDDRTGGNELTGEIPEVIYYDGQLSLANQIKIESYLAIKYGITLDNTDGGTNGDYMASSGSTPIWDASSNSGAYHNNVTGIGRDDDSGLYQRQSKSENASNLGDDTDDITIGLGSIETTNILNTNRFNTDASFLLWGHNNLGINAGSILSTNLSDGISGLTTNVTITPIERVWKVVETGTVETTTISIPQAMLSAVSGVNGDYFMLVSNSDTFSASSTGVKLTLNGTNLEATYDFTGTEYITFGYAPYTIEERSIYFDGSSYIDMGDVLNLNPTAFTISAWIKRDVNERNGSIISKRDHPHQNGFDFKIFRSSGNARLRMKWEIGNTDQNLESNTLIPENEWHHVAAIYNTGMLYLYIDGVEDISALKTPMEDNNFSFLVGAADGEAPRSFFKGNIDEVRIWDVALSVDQLRYMMNQEIEEHSDNTVTGVIIPQNIPNNEVNTLDWVNDLAAYYPMSKYAFPNVLIDDSGNGNNGALMNLNTVDLQTAPLPYVSVANTNWDVQTTWDTNTFQTVPGAASIVDVGQTVDWSIVKIADTGTGAVDIDSGDGNGVTLLGLISDANSTLKVAGTTDLDGTGEGQSIIVSHYLELDGIIDLEGESQLIQTEGSILDAASSGSLERDQQGTADTYSYNYWSSPVGITKESADVAISDYSYTLDDVLYDGINKVNFISGKDGSDSNPVTISEYWIYTYVNKNGDYSEWDQVSSSGVIDAGVGYTMKGPGSGAVTDFQNYTFIGKPNNGDISLTISNGYEYLVGNPYPSALDADQFIVDNGPTIDGAEPSIDGTLYFWEHWGGGSHKLADYQGGYATYNLSGGVGNGSKAPEDGASKVPLRFIPVAQGFFVKAEATGTVSFKNSQRIFEMESDGGSIFMKEESSKKTIASKSTSKDTRSKIRLGFEAPKIGHRQLLLTIDDRATANVDWGFDGKKLDNLEQDMYWDLDADKYIIQALPNVNIGVEVPIGISMGKEGVATIKIDALENTSDDLELYIKDALTGLTHQINNIPFEIELEAGEYVNRFSLVFAPDETLSDNEEVLEKGLFVYMNNTSEELQIRNNTNSSIQRVRLFSSLGQLLQSWNKGLDNTTIALPVSNKSTGVYIVQIVSESGTISKKVIID